VLVSASAVGWYGTHGEKTFAENAASGADFPAVVCRAWEREARAAQALGVRVAILRLGLVLGHGGFLARLTPVFGAGLGAPLGNGRQWMPWIHIDDVLALIDTALEDAQYSGAFNAVAPQNVSNREFSRTFARVLRRPLWPALPAWLLRKTLGEMAMLLLEGQRVVPARLMSLGYRFRYASLETALAQIAGRAPRATIAKQQEVNYVQ
jgi:uncharacterized protein